MTVFHKTSMPFPAKWGGTCALGNCEKDRVIDPGDTIAFIDEHIMHLRCIRRVERGETDPWCEGCARYHDGSCE